MAAHWRRFVAAPATAARRARQGLSPADDARLRAARAKTRAARTQPTAVFGYGSVVWKFPYPHSKQWAPVCVRGYERVFYQGSTDHRGTPEAPGRTVTLVPQEGGVVWGACFLIDGPEEAAVLAEMEVSRAPRLWRHAQRRARARPCSQERARTRADAGMRSCAHARALERALTRSIALAHCACTRASVLAGS